MYSLAGGSTKAAIAPCNVGCKTLSTKDYIDLLWTTLAEFPGEYFNTLIADSQ
jgi:hypothetical protein